jgi:dUTP pyrophosphatase
VRIPLVLLDPDLPTPARAHEGDAGVDLHAREAVVLRPGERAAVPTGIALALPSGYAGLVVPRSGLARRRGLGIVNAPGVIDSGYRGEVAVVLVNHGADVVAIERGDRIAQLLVVAVALVELEIVDDLPPSRRGEGGFGSTGS